MGITMSPQDYATAFRILAASARHPENILQAVEERILPRLPKQRALLDVGAGSGKVAKRIAPHFDSLTLLEPNQNQIAGCDFSETMLFGKEHPSPFQGTRAGRRHPRPCRPQSSSGQPARPPGRQRASPKKP